MRRRKTSRKRDYVGAVRETFAMCTPQELVELEMRAAGISFEEIESADDDALLSVCAKHPNFAEALENHRLSLG